MLLEAADLSPEVLGQNSLRFLSPTSPKSQHTADLSLGDRGSYREELPSSNLQSGLRTPRIEGHSTVPCSWCVAGYLRQTSFPSTHDAAGFSSDENWIPKKILFHLVQSHNAKSHKAWWCSGKQSWFKGFGENHAIKQCFDFFFFLFFHWFQIKARLTGRYYIYLLKLRNKL